VALRAGLDRLRLLRRLAAALCPHGACRRARRSTERLDQRGHDAIATTATDPALTDGDGAFLRAQAGFADRRCPGGPVRAGRRRLRGPIRRSPNGAAHTSPQTDRDRPEWVIGINRNH
jgi:hypothetical protein